MTPPRPKRIVPGRPSRTREGAAYDVEMQRLTTDGHMIVRTHHGRRWRWTGEPLHIGEWVQLPDGSIEQVRGYGPLGSDEPSGEIVRRRTT